MTDSTIDNKPGEGDFDVGSSAEELFGGIDEESPESTVDRDGDGDAASTDDETADASDSNEIEDQTAASVFGQLKGDVDADAADEVLADESPDDIIASADEPDPNHEPVDDALRPDDDELADLLLTGRTKDQEFLWIDPDEDEDKAAADTDTAADTGLNASSETDESRGEDSSSGPRLEGIDSTEEITEPTTDPESATVETTDSETTTVETTEPESAATGVVDTDTADDHDGESSTVESTATPADDEIEQQALAVHESETAAVPATEDDAEDEASPGFVRRLLAKLNPF